MVQITPVSALINYTSFAIGNSLVACSSVAFGAAKNFGVGIYPYSVTVSDFNGDGRQDLATANYQSHTVSILLGNGAGSFGAATNFGVATFPSSIATGDFNNDGMQDVATSNFLSNNVSVLLGNGTGSFSAATNFGIGLGPYDIVAGDFNSDGMQDLATANSTSNNISILLGDGTGGFSAAMNFGAGLNPSSIAIGDFNGDGRQDLTATNGGMNNISILLGDGTGSFGPSTNFGAANFPFFVAVGDFNGDGKQDLTANNHADSVAILLGNGTGSFGTATYFGVGIGPAAIVVGDLNGDGKQDLVTANLHGDNVSVLLGSGAGSFGAATNFGVGTSPLSVAVGDFNGDGKLDLATANHNSNNISILLNTCNTVAPTVVSTSLLASNVGTGPATFTVTFSEAVNNPAGNTNKDDVTNPNNYLLVNTGANSLVETASCSGGVVADDIRITVTSVIYDSGTFTSRVTLASALPPGKYRLFVCGTTSIVDIALTPLNNGAFDYIFGFVVTPGSLSLPDTGFAPNRITSLSAQPSNIAYMKLDDIWMEIPALNVKANIVGVPKLNNTWDVDWLGNDTGWLNGTAFPSWDGNSVITGHVYNASGLPGPFANLKSLKYGDQIIIHLYGGQYIFEIRKTLLVRPGTTDYALQHLEDNSFLTLITCQGYNEKNNSYRFRRIVRAVLIEVRDE
jgi:LPXTG-site transpeptidase (sortase) family protein